MCYAIPGKVIELKDKIAIIDYFGEQKNALNELETLSIGDYVYAQGGFVIEKIPEKEAAYILNNWRESFFRLKEIDLSLLKATGKIKIKNKNLNEIIQKTEKGISLKKEEILYLLRTNNKDELKLLFSNANKMRQKHLKNSCCVHGIIEFSNYCRNNCLYCGIRMGNKNLDRYRMDIDEIVEIADYAVNKLGFKALVLQSGEDTWYDTDKLVEIIKRIKEKCKVLLFMSIGERDKECYKKMYDSGARGILVRFETSNPFLYKKIHSGLKSKFENRIGLLHYANKLGFLIATGSIIGLPGQREEDLVDDILLTSSLNAEMYSFGPLIPNPETPFKNEKKSDINSVLKVIAISRLLNPNAKILVTTALETLNRRNGRKMGLLAGANSLMINVTPCKYKQKYSIYPGRPDLYKETAENIKSTLELLYSIGRAPTDLGK